MDTMPSRFPSPLWCTEPMPPRTLPLALLLLLPVGVTAQDVHMEKALRVLQAVPLVDGHNDLPWYIRNDFKQAPLDVEAYDLRRPTTGNTALARLQRGMVGGQFWSVYVPGDWRDSGFARVSSSRSTLPDALSRSTRTCCNRR